MENRRAKIVMTVSVEIEDPLAVVSSRLRMVTDGATGQVVPDIVPPEQVDFAVMDVLMRAVNDAVDQTPGMTYLGSSSMVEPS